MVVHGNMISVGFAAWGTEKSSLFFLTFLSSQEKLSAAIGKVERKSTLISEVFGSPHVVREKPSVDITVFSSVPITASGLQGE